VAAYFVFSALVAIGCHAMPDPIVLELQRDALSPSFSTTELLPTAKVVAYKLNLKEFTEWIELELSEYRKGEDCPKYRDCKGTPEAQDPYGRGWTPIVFQNSSTEEHVSKWPIADVKNDFSDLTSQQVNRNIPFYL
jgi:hypothetical protein